MSSDPNSQLLEALERGDLQEIAQALQSGASPNARKSVTLCVNVNGKMESETVMVESALLLSVRSSNVEILRMLLNSRATDVNSAVDWKIAFPHAKWTQRDWETLRWTNNSFASLTEFALVRGPLYFNKPGARITVTDPSTGEDVSDFFQLVPSVEIVELRKSLVMEGIYKAQLIDISSFCRQVLNCGAQFGDAEMRRARELRDGKDRYGQQFPANDAFLRLLKARQGQFRSSDRIIDGGSLPRHRSNVSSGSGDAASSTSSKLAHAQELARVAEKLTEQMRLNEKLRETIDELRKQLTGSGNSAGSAGGGSGGLSSNDRLRNRLTELENQRQQLAILAARVPELERERQHLATQLASKTVELDTERARFERKLTAGDAQNSRLQEAEREKGRLGARIAELERERQTLSTQSRQLEAEKSTLTAKITDLETANQALQAEKAAAESRFSLERSRSSQLLQELAAERAVSSQLRQQLAAVHADKDQLQQQLSAERAQAAMAGQTSNLDRARLVALEQNLAGERLRASALEKEGRDAHVTIATLKDKLQAANAAAGTGMIAAATLPGRTLPYPPNVPTTLPRNVPFNYLPPSEFQVSTNPSHPLTHTQDSNVRAPSPVQNPFPTPKPVGKIMFATTSFLPTSEDEIPLNEREEVYVVHVFADGWAQGTNSRKQSGVFPFVCCAPTRPQQPIISKRTSSTRAPKAPNITMPAPASSIAKPDATSANDFRPYGAQTGAPQPPAALSYKPPPLPVIPPHPTVPAFENNGEIMSVAISDTDSGIWHQPTSVFGARLNR
ncbi:hypothetical protein HDU93_002765 [Gonapodya sp. JEL0774]|nr:hypothetical protein HDU93_002765 [Gonapodya sp. JEL0774]